MHHSNNKKPQRQIGAGARVEEQLIAALWVAKRDLLRELTERKLIS